ncbi:hypothetical protein [Neobacillus terrae]|nr:hypothetical protein [Neobacillus terrae]NHM30101.1 hypothetical protein [Neobacillus terrae]
MEKILINHFLGVIDHFGQLINHYGGHINHEKDHHYRKTFTVLSPINHF